MSDSLASKIFVAFWTFGLAFFATFIFSSLVSPVTSPFFLIAVMISAWRGGFLAGFFATFLSASADILYFLPSDSSSNFQSEEISQFIVDIFASIIIGTLSASTRRAENEREAILESEKKARLEAENANNVKDEFLATVSHELRTPLTTIKTLTHFLRHKNPSENEKKEYLADIASECDRQIDLVHNLLDLSRIQIGGVDINLRKTDIEKVLRDCAKIERIEASAHQHKVEIDVEQDLPFALADASALRRSICTMLENSIKYTPDGGLIKMSARSFENDRIAVKIEDNGRGIHPQDLPHIFESFYRGHLMQTDGVYTFSEEQEVKGIGLGLHLANILIKGMKGEIIVSSEVGKGSVFTVILNIWKAKK